MRDALSQFEKNIGRARDLVGLATALQAQTTTAVDVSDLLRAATVLAVSALDHFVHELTRKGMLEIAYGARPATDSYLRFSVSLRSVSLFKTSGGSVWLDQEIRERHGWLSFQDPNKLADALRHVTGKKVWEEIGARLGIASEDAKRQLRLIVDRRNKIAHEADSDPTVPGQRWPISVTMVDEAVAFLDKLAVAIIDTVL